MRMRPNSVSRIFKRFSTHCHLLTQPDSNPDPRLTLAGACLLKLSRSPPRSLLRKSLSWSFPPKEGAKSFISSIQLGTGCWTWKRKYFQPDPGNRESTFFSMSIRAGTFLPSWRGLKKVKLRPRFPIRPVRPEKLIFQFNYYYELGISLLEGNLGAYLA